MPTLDSSPRSFPIIRGARRALTFSALCASAALTACGGGGGEGGGGIVTPGGQRATIALTPQVLLAPGTTGATLQVTTLYERTIGDPVALTSATSVPVTGGPVVIDLSSCLADLNHRGGDACFVRGTVSLVAGDRVLDTQGFAALSLKGGATAAQAVSLAEVASVRVTAPAVGGDSRARVDLGTPVTATAAALDANGGVLAGRTIVWSVDAPAVAAVDAATGVVTPVAPGQARLTAAAGTRQGTLDLTVAAPISVVVTSGTGSGTVTSSPAGIACTITAGVASGTCAAGFAGGVNVTLTAAPAAGSSFSVWSRDCAASGGALTCTLTPSAARTAGVAFTAVRNLAVTLTGTGAGRVTSTPAGIDCRSGTCTSNFGDGATVTLTASPADGGSTFAGWGGECVGTTAPCVVTLDRARAVSATFTTGAADTVTVSAAGPVGLQGRLEVDGVLNGRPFVSGLGINLNTSNAAPQFTFYVDPGTQATLRFTANDGATFTSWGGACTGTATATACMPVPARRSDAIVNLAPR